MSSADRLLYHQIHPLKVLTDVSTAATACFLFWEHRTVAALLVGFLPSIVVSVLLVRWADLEPYRRSALGRYVGRFMTRQVELARFAGLIPLWGGAGAKSWAHRGRRRVDRGMLAVGNATSRCVVSDVERVLSSLL